MTPPAVAATTLFVLVIGTTAAMLIPSGEDIAGHALYFLILGLILFLPFAVMWGGFADGAFTHEQKFHNPDDCNQESLVKGDAGDNDACAMSMWPVFGGYWFAGIWIYIIGYRAALAIRRTHKLLLSRDDESGQQI